MFRRLCGLGYLHCELQLNGGVGNIRVRSSIDWNALRVSHRKKLSTYRARYALVRANDLESPSSGWMMISLEHSKLNSIYKFHLQNG